MDDTYRILCPIGKGGTSHVYLGFHNNLKKYVVIKKLKGEFTEDNLSEAEVETLKNLTHQYLPVVYDYRRIPNQTGGFDVYTVIDYVEGHNLLELFLANGPLPEQYLKKYLRQLAEVLVYIHGQRKPVYHCDIKPENIMIDQNGNVKLIDFNTAIGGNQDNLLGWTEPYASPEQVIRSSCAADSAPLDGRTDLYSLGATFYLLISGRKPMHFARSPQLQKMGLKGYSHEFLALIDRLMEFDREDRLQSAKKLLTAIDRQDSRYWQLFAIRCASYLVSAVFVASGLFCLIRGTQLVPAEAYYEQYAAVQSYIKRGDLDQAEGLCLQMLGSSKTQRYLEGETGEQARFYHMMGDIHYYREEYPSAAGYYAAAVQLCGGCSAQEQLTFYRDAAIAYAQAGDLSTGQAYLTAARQMPGAGGELLLAEAVIAAQSGDSGTCIEKVTQLLNDGEDRQLCFRAALTAASVCTDADARISWYTTATRYDSGKTALRGLAKAWGEKCQCATDGTARAEAFANATNLYGQLCADPYASAVDWINYSIVLRENDQQDQAVQVLLAALQNDPNNVRVQIHLCLAYYELDNGREAGVWYTKALESWQADNSAQKLPQESEEIQNLLEVGRRLGIGGGL